MVTVMAVGEVCRYVRYVEGEYSVMNKMSAKGRAEMR